MRVSVNWLSEWVDLPDTVEELEERLTMGGLEIEEVIRTGPDLSGLRVGLVVEHARHPDADRLSVCRVDLGEDEPLEVVCGAPNVAAGQKVPAPSPRRVRSQAPFSLQLMKTEPIGSAALSVATPSISSTRSALPNASQSRTCITAWP